MTSLTAAANKRLLLVATKSLELSGTKMRRKNYDGYMLDLGYVQICVFIADCEYSLALVQHGLPVQARGWLRPWPGITCNLHPDHNTAKPPPFPIHRPAMDPQVLLLLSNISYLLSPFSLLAV